MSRARRGTLASSIWRCCQLNIYDFLFIFIFYIYLTRLSLSLSPEGGYTNGFFLTSIVVDILKHQLASPRPYYLVLCPRLVAYCGNNTDADHHLNHSVVEELCSELDSFELSEARMSFPSSSTSLATYSAMFLLLYTSFVTAHRGLRWARIWVVLALVVLPALVATSRVQSNHNHVVDVVVGAALGASIAVYIVFVHLNVFANRITVSNFFTANRQATKHESSAGATSKHHEESADKEWYWKSFHIPRVYNLRATAVADPIDGSSLGRGDRGETARGSHAALRPKVIEATRFDGFSLDSPNAFVNPAFEPQEENIRLEPIVTSTTANDNNNNYIPHIRRGPRPPPPPVPQPMKTFHH